jgi:RNA recognition motif-containing protein
MDRSLTRTRSGFSSRTVIVENLPENITDQMLREFFSPLYFTGVRRDSRNEGLAGVEFGNAEEARSAVGRDGYKLEGRRLRCRLAEARDQKWLKNAVTVLLKSGIFLLSLWCSLQYVVLMQYRHS